MRWGFSVVKNPPVNAEVAGDMDLIPRSGRDLEVGNGNSLPYSCLENSMNRGAWQGSVHGITKSQTQLSTHTHTRTHTHTQSFGNMKKYFELEE